jgi:hypothetical protein
MKRNISFFFGTVIAASAFLMIGAGCGSSGGGNGGGGNTGTGGMTNMGGSGTGGGSSVKLDCASYCGEVMTNCTGALAQFSDMTTCMGTCAGFPAGTLSDKSGDTLGCRIYHGGAAKTDATTHCPHAGPTGGDKDPTDTAAGACGEACDAFCNIALKVCAGQTDAYADMAACMTECKTFKADTADYSTADTSTNDYGCRMYHLTAASADASAAMMHCPHIRATSPVCTM